MNKMAMGGVQLPFYNTDNAGNPMYAMGGGYPAMTNPYNNFRGSIPMYPDGGINAQGLTKPEYEQAQRDSSVIYKSGLAKIPNYQFPGFTESSMREGLRTNPRSPAIKTATGQPYGSDAGVNMMDSEASDFSNFKTTRVPWQEYIPGTEKSGVAIENKPLEKPVSSPNWGSTTILKDGRHLRAYPDGHTEIVGNPRKVVNVGNLEKKKYGGQMLPKFLVGGRYIDGVWVEDNQPTAGFQTDAWQQSSGPVNNIGENSNVNNLITNKDFNKFKNANAEITNDQIINQNNKDRMIGNTNARMHQANRLSGESQYLPDNNNVRNNPNLKQTQRETDPNSKNFDWGSLALNAGNFAGQNMGNIYDLSRKNAPLQKYDRATGKFLDPTKAIAGENYIYRQTKNTLPGLTGGNAGATMALLFANKANTATRIGRLRETYDNANAQIGNQLSQYNTEIAYREAEARAKDAAMKENIRSQAIHGIGSSFGKATKSGKQDEMDEKTLAMYKEYYNNPQFRAALKKAGYDV
jgi:gas vesicle protein